MKINRTNSSHPPTENEVSDETAKEKPARVTHSPTPENSATSNRFHQPYNANANAYSQLPPLDLSRSSTPGSIKKIEDSLLVVAQKVLSAKTPADANNARQQIIDIIIHENFHNLLNTSEQHQITDTLKLALANDPLFCAEVDRMLQLAAQKLKSEA